MDLACILGLLAQPRSDQSENARFFLVSPRQEGCEKKSCDEADVWGKSKGEEVCGPVM